MIEAGQAKGALFSGPEVGVAKAGMTELLGHLLSWDSMEDVAAGQPGWWQFGWLGRVWYELQGPGVTISWIVM